MSQKEKFKKEKVYSDIVGMNRKNLFPLFKPLTAINTLIDLLHLIRCLYEMSDCLEPVVLHVCLLVCFMHVLNKSCIIL